MEVASIGVVFKAVRMDGVTLGVSVRLQIDHGILRVGNDFSVLQFNLFNKSNLACLYSQMSRNSSTK